MKIGMAISAAILLVLGIALYLKLQPNPADRPTPASADANLAEQKLPDDLPGFGVSPGSREDDGKALLEAINQSRNVMLAGGFPDEKARLSRLLADEMKRAARARLAAGFLDRLIPANQFESPELVQATLVLQKAVRLRIDQHLDDAAFEQAPELAASYLAFGRQAFERNTRLKARQRGLAIMKAALGEISRIATAAGDDGAIEPEEVAAIKEDAKQWSDAIGAIENAWNTKLKSIDSVRAAESLPNTADLIRVANRDKDRTFRVFAALRLGYARFERGDAGNLKQVNAALDELETSDDAMVADAAKAARAIEDAAQYHELRK